MSEINIKEDDGGFVKGAFSLTLATLIVKLIGFIYKLPLSYILTDEGMGYFNSAYTVFSFFFLLCTGGVPRAISIIITDSNAKDERCGILRVTLKLFFIIGAALFLILFFLAHVLSNIIGSEECQYSLMAIAPSLLFVAISGVLRGYLNGIMSFGAISLSQIGEGIVKFVFGMLFALLGVRLGYDFPIISALSILGVTLGSLVSTVILYVGAVRSGGLSRTVPALKLSSLAPKLFRISAPITLSSAILGASSLVDLTLIMRRLIDSGATQTEATALYGNYSTLVIPMINLVLALLTPISAAALPMLGSYIKVSLSEYTSAARELFRIFLFILVPVSLAFLIFPREILYLLFEDSSAEIAYIPLALSSPSILFLGLLTLSNTVLEANKDTVKPLIATVVGVVIKTIITYFLIPEDGIGISGAAIGNSISYAVSFLLSFIFLNFKKIKINIIPDFLIFGVFGLSSLVFSKVLYQKLCDGQFSSLYFIICAILAIIIYLTFSGLFLKFSAKKGKKPSILTKIKQKN